MLAFTFLGIKFTTVKEVGNDLYSTVRRVSLKSIQPQTIQVYFFPKKRPVVKALLIFLPLGCKSIVFSECFTNN